MRQDDHTAKKEDYYDNFQYKIYQNEDPPEDYKFTYFDQDKYSNKQKHWMYNIRSINFRKTGYIKLSVPKQVRFLILKINTKRKVKIMEYCCGKTSF